MKLTLKTSGVAVLTVFLPSIIPWSIVLHLYSKYLLTPNSTRWSSPSTAILSIQLSSTLGALCLRPPRSTYQKLEARPQKIILVNVSVSVLENVLKLFKQTSSIGLFRQGTTSHVYVDILQIIRHVIDSREPSHASYPTAVSTKDMASEDIYGQKEGGYEVQLVNGAPCGIDVFCPVCTLVLRDPVQFKCCSRHLCESCYKKCPQQYCPQCGTEDPKAFTDGAWSRIIHGLRIYCRNKQRGCYWENELRLLTDHLRTCSCEMIDCTRFCGFSVERRNQEFHMDNICRFRPFNCQYCSLRGTFESVTATHYSVCLEYPLNCPNQCKDEVIKRKDMKSHMAACPLEEIACVFAEVECTFKCQRKDMANHLQSSVQEHLTLTMETVRHLKLRVKTLEEKQ